MSENKNTRAALSLAAIVAGMLMLSFAAVPLYNIFCKVTGFGGTTGQSAELPEHVVDREVKITFSSTIDPNLPWRFEPLEKEIRVKVGENRLTAYESENMSDEAITGVAVYNVTPFEAGQYFKKIQCFCFDEQTLDAHEVVNMPISFYIDPEFADDPELKAVKEITLSYTFYNESSQN